MDDIINARKKLNKLIEVVKTGFMGDIGDYIDKLTKEECKLILRMIVYGDWKRFDEI